MGKLLALGPDSSLVEVLRRFTLASANVRAGAGSATLATVTDGTTPWSFALEAGKIYRIIVIGGHRSNTATTGIKLGVNSSGGLLGTATGSVYASIASGAAASELKATIHAITGGGAAGTGIQTTGVNPINIPHANGMDFVFECATSGTMTIEFASEIAGSTVLMAAGSTLLVQEI